MTTRISTKDFRALKATVFVTDLESGPRKLASGLLLPDDNMAESGIRERWGQIAYLGPDVPEELSVGDWVLVKHGRWTPGIDLDDGSGALTRIWRVEYPDAVLLASDNDPRPAKRVSL